MSADVALDASSSPHVPVLIDEIIELTCPAGAWVDATFGAGGYSRRLLAAGARPVIGIDRDPLAFELAKEWRDEFGDRLVLQQGSFSKLAELTEEFVPLQGVVFDLGVSSMQLDRANRGFSFLRDGPLDMRMGQSGTSAADLVNSASESVLADILFQYGEERASRRIARAIIASRPIETTLQLADLVETVLPKSKPGQSHAATRTFQAIRIAVNNEFGELIAGLEAAEKVLEPGGFLAVVTFHSLEDRVVKKFMASRCNPGGAQNRYMPDTFGPAPSFKAITKKAVATSADELLRNPRARSAKLRVVQRLDAAALEADRHGLGLPKLAMKTVV